MSNALASKKCVPCSGGTPPLTGQELEDLHEQLDSGWHLEGEHHIEKEFTFDDFAQALAFTNTVGGVAEEQDHHPDIYLSYGKVKVKIWTHKIDGLTESDFVFAAKVEEAAQG